MRSIWIVLVVIAAGCGGSAEVESTVATIAPVRGETRLGDERAPDVARAAVDDAVRTGERALTRLSLDLGPQLLVDAETEVALIDGGTVELRSGRLFAESRAGECLELRHDESTLRAADASLSARVSDDGLHVYVVRGEVSWTRGEERGIAAAGEELTLGDAGASTSPATLWHDWTGGLARPGPDDGAGPAGVGVLEARVPDELGRARWPLVIRRLDVRVRVEADLAITEVDQLFFNPASETVEGLYRIRVPESAVLQRFAVDRHGSLVDGYVREREQARQAYDQQVYRGSNEDPALLEWDAPGSYRARIYPIRPGETRRVVIRYAEWLHPPAEGAPRVYRYPMGGGARPPHIQELSIVADVAESGAEEVRAGMGAQREEGAVRVRRSDFRPRADFWMELVGGAGETQRAWIAEHGPPARAPGTVVSNEADERDYFYLPLILPEALAPAERAEGLDLVIMADVSAATDRSHLELGRSVAESLAAHLDERDRVAIVSSDLRIRPVDGAAPALVEATRENVDRLLNTLARAPAGGASDLGQAIADAAALLDPARPGAIVYIGDGAPTVGELRAAGLLERIERLPHPVRLYAIAVGSEADLELLAALTRGGGLAMRVEARAQAARAAMRVLAHAERPIAHDVEVALGDGIENAFPRRPMDAVLGEVFPVVGRVRGDLPEQVTVKGVIAGEPFEQTIEVEVADTEAATDLRLRWASERLRQLLLEGGGREEVADLGVRYGLITPFTSYYVPSQSELARTHARHLIDRPLLPVGEGTSTGDRIAQGILAVALGPLSIAGCTMSEDEPGSAEAPVAVEESRAVSAEQAAPSQTDTPGFGDREATVTAESTPAPEPAPAPPPAEAEEALDPWGSADVAANEPAPNAGFGTAGAPQRRRAPRREHRAPSPTGSEGGGASPRDGAEALATGANDRGGLPEQFLERALEDEDTESPVGRWLAGARPAEPEADSTTVVIRQTVYRPAAHRARRCSDAAGLPLDDRRALWRERLANAHGAAAWLRLSEDARRDCEARTWRDRRAFLQLILQRAGSIGGMLSVYRLLDASGPRRFVRTRIFDRVRSPDDLRQVREAFGLGDEVDWTLVEQVLARATTEGERIRALRRLSAQHPESFDLKLRLLAALERAARPDEAKRLAHQMRADPLADPGVRTAIGEMFLRMGKEGDARRAFSEIVEFAPLDELARRRLGDLYRAHGWYEDAYRQYQTLREIRPDDPSVLLLLAQAAAGAGRTDEALRLERRLMQTAQPGRSVGIARTALLWSSVRYARLRQTADADKLEALERRIRASGVLREAGALRVTLVWSHPDAQLALWAGLPGLSPTRPSDIMPEYGIEALHLEEQEPGAYAIEVRRTPDENGALTPITAQLVVIWNEGEDDEQIEIVDLAFDRERTEYAWTLQGRALTEVVR